MQVCLNLRLSVQYKQAFSVFAPSKASGLILHAVLTTLQDLHQANVRLGSCCKSRRRRRLTPYSITCTPKNKHVLLSDCEE